MQQRPGGNKPRHGGRQKHRSGQKKAPAIFNHNQSILAMKTSVRFNRAVSALVSAYLNDTLECTDCHACAVGNIVAAGYGEKVRRISANLFVCRVQNDAWASIFLGGVMVPDPTTDPEYSKGLENIAVTGYTDRDLAKVEYAFMFPYNIDSTLLHNWDDLDESDKTHQRLLACVDVLCDIEGITDPAPYKAQFDKALPLADIIVG